MKPPALWQHHGALLAPLSVVVTRITAVRVARPGWHAPVPVICCGNAGVGGAGKTTVVLSLARLLQSRGLAVHLLTRGHGGSAAGVLRVDAAWHTAREVGDEALLLAACAPTWRAADRAAGARAAVADGAQVLVMDDGLQNPGLHKTVSLLVIDGGAGFGNGRVLPAGPLREPVAAAAARCARAVLIGPDRVDALAQLPPALEVLHARLEAGSELAALAGRRLAAFAGIGRPEKFFDMLDAAGACVVRRDSFADHHRFTQAELRRLVATARALDAVPVTTPKDHVRIPEADRAFFTAIGVVLTWAEPAMIAAFLDDALAG